ncbi:serine hydrolase domain-containing protein [Microlunatus soli]|uniref:CubicO group peptidase, beta-lactamase class C family n=1 Tax=Microlunatus soli TaxID=630515 RepID=A0A1H1UFT3_9ACTN|nr:serine hydrolase domain-containing protein [Microlunatus soli]SDS71141.1 CubicO group peptidase, beta-lactamase class C family [Microlunatus soli]
MGYFNDRVSLTRSAVRELFTERIEQGRAPGSVYAVFDRSGIIYADGLGDRGDGRPPTADTAFRIASCTKSFTAAALLIMVERGLVGLDDPIDTLVKVGPMIGPDGAPSAAPTLRQLVSMAAGLPTDDPWADRQESLSAEAFAAIIADGIRFSGRPGRQYEYSNLGFALLGAVIERVTGRGYVDVVTEELIKPLGLSGVGYDTGVEGTDGLATGFVKVDDEWESQDFSAPGAFSPIGGVFATARGLSQWIGWLTEGFTELDDHDQPLGRLSRRLMQTPQTTIPSGAVDPQSYGMGLVIEDNGRHGTIAAHSGGYPGFGSHMRWHPESGIGVLAFENARYAAPIAPVTRALQLILDETLRPDAEPGLWPETIAARDAVEQLLRRWDDAAAEALFADNVDLDEALSRRASAIADLVAEVAPDDEALALIDSAPVSRTPAQLAWTVPGRHGSLRCEIRLTPTNPPKVQTLTVRRG